MKYFRNAIIVDYIREYDGNGKTFEILFVGLISYLIITIFNYEKSAEITFFIVSLMTLFLFNKKKEYLYDKYLSINKLFVIEWLNIYISLCLLFSMCLVLGGFNLKKLITMILIFSMINILFYVKFYNKFNWNAIFIVNFSLTIATFDKILNSILDIKESTMLLIALVIFFITIYLSIYYSKQIYYPKNYSN